jgi:acetyltransferase-like isoleucine patch superfamily enzyme
MFNYVGSTKVGKGTVIDKGGYICQEYLELGENCYLGPMSGQSSHVNEGVYGGFTLKKIKMGDNSVLCTRCMLAPGVEIGKNTQILSISGVTKFSKLKSNSSYYGLPAGRISEKRFHKYIQLPEKFKIKKKEEGK